MAKKKTNYCIYCKKEVFSDSLVQVPNGVMHLSCWMHVYAHPATVKKELVSKRLKMTNVKDEIAEFIQNASFEVTELQNNWVLLSINNRESSGHILLDKEASIAYSIYAIQ